MHDFVLKHHVFIHPKLSFRKQKAKKDMNNVQSNGTVNVQLFHMFEEMIHVMRLLASLMTHTANLSRSRSQLYTVNKPLKLTEICNGHN